MNTRATAARLLQQVVYGGQSLTDVLLQPEAQAIPPNSQSLLRDLCFGTLRWYGRLAAVLERLLSKPLRVADKDVECLLLLGLYQLVYQRIPDHAAVHETVKAARKLHKPWADKLLNGVLRQFLRERDSLLDKCDQHPAIRHAFPPWLLERIQQAWPDDWESVVQASNHHAPLTLRVNLRQGTVEEYRQRLAEAGMQADTVPFAPSALNLHQAVGVEQLPGFAQGAVSVQDAAAQLAAGLLACQPGMRVLDACAAPGGKTGHLLETTPDLQLLALDSHPGRLQRVTDNLNRLQLHATTVSADAAAIAGWWDGKPFERILLDAPCSATGVIRRHPDIKVLRRAGDLPALQQAQSRLLQALWSVLQPGGRLLYATCSLLPEENSQQVAAFLDKQPDAIPVAIESGWGKAQVPGQQVLPGSSNQDGFYYALLQKAQ